MATKMASRDELEEGNREPYLQAPCHGIFYPLLYSCLRLV